MKILHVIDHLGPGGAQDVLLNILRYKPENISSYLFIFRPIDKERLSLFQRFADCYVFAFPNVLLPKELARFLRTLKMIKPEIVHGHLEFSSLLVTIFRRFIKRLVITVYSIPAQIGLIKRFILLLSAGYADWVFVSDQIQTRYYSKANNKLSYITLGSNFREWKRGNEKSRSQWRQELGLLPDAKVLLHIGRFIPEKGHASAILITKELVDRGLQIKTIFIGCGKQTYYQKLIELKNKLSLNSNVEFKFTLDIYPWIFCADGFLSTCMNENMGVVIYDAISAGLPVFSRDTGTIREVIRHGKNGLLANKRRQLADYIDTYFRDGNWCVDDNSNMYANENIIPQYYRTYSHVLAGRS